MSIQQRIMQIRKHKGLSQKVFSAAIGVSQSYLSEVENGKSKPSIEMLTGISNRFDDINTEWLLTGRGEMLREDVLRSVVAKSAVSSFEQLMNQLTQSQQRVVLAMTQEMLKSNQLEAQLKKVATPAESKWEKVKG